MLYNKTGAKYLGFFLLSFPQNERKIYYLCWVSFAQFVYFLREVCLLINFWMIKFTIMFFRYLWILSFKNTNWAKLIYFSLVLREWEEKKPKYFAPWTKLAIAIIQATTAMVNLMSILIEFVGFFTKFTGKKERFFLRMLKKFKCGRNVCV